MNTSTTHTPASVIKLFNALEDATVEFGYQIELGRFFARAAEFSGYGESVEAAAQDLYDTYRLDLQTKARIAKGICITTIGGKFTCQNYFKKSADGCAICEACQKKEREQEAAAECAEARRNERDYQ